MSDQFIKYFSETIEYPTIGIDILPMNVNYEYVSSTFLNGFINYVNPIKAFVLGRYEDWNTPLNEGRGHAIFLMSPPNSLNWKTIHCKTKNELYEELTVKGVTFHVNLDSDFQDDVLILAKSTVASDGEWCYFYFWYDRDCSDCSIGRFQTEDNEELVITKFVLFCKELSCNEFGEKEIPLHYFNGWMEG